MGARVVKRMNDHDGYKLGEHVTAQVDGHWLYARIVFITEIISVAEDAEESLSGRFAFMLGEPCLSDMYDAVVKNAIVYDGNNLRKPVEFPLADGQILLSGAVSEGSKIDEDGEYSIYRYYVLACSVNPSDQSGSISYMTSGPPVPRGIDPELAKSIGIPEGAGGISNNHITQMSSLDDDDITVLTEAGLEFIFLKNIGHR